MLTLCKLTSWISPLLLLLWQFHTLPFIHAMTFTYNQFKKLAILLIKDASIHSEQVLTLTNSSQSSIGRALYPTSIRLKTSNATLVSFSTSFVFSIVALPPGPRGHGLAFIMSPYKSLMGAIESQYLGLFNATTNGLESNHLFAVEFDTNFNVEFGDIDNNHVGVNLNSLTSLQDRSLGYWMDEEFHSFSLTSRENIQAWIDYDHHQDQLNVTVSLAGILICFLFQ